MKEFKLYLKNKNIKHFMEAYLPGLSVFLIVYLTYGLFVLIDLKGVAIFTLFFSAFSVLVSLLTDYLEFKKG